MPHIAQGTHSDAHRCVLGIEIGMVDVAVNDVHGGGGGGDDDGGGGGGWRDWRWSEALSPSITL